MKVLVIGGTRFFGISTVNKLLELGYDVTLATRGRTVDSFGKFVNRIKLDIYDSASVKAALKGKTYDVVIDKMGYGSSDIANILDNVECQRFIHMSTAGVYQLDHYNIKEEEFNPLNVSLEWYSRGELEYDSLKRLAEAAIMQKYPYVSSIMVRSPFVLGENDYTNRLNFYIEHVKKQKAMYIDNIDQNFCVARAQELGEFMADIIMSDLEGPVNYCSNGLLSVRDIISYVEKLLGTKAVISDSGDQAPYNGTVHNSLDVSKAEKICGSISNVNTWIFDLIEKNARAL